MRRILTVALAVGVIGVGSIAPSVAQAATPSPLSRALTTTQGVANHLGNELAYPGVVVFNAATMDQSSCAYQASRIACSAKIWFLELNYQYVAPPANVYFSMTAQMVYTVGVGGKLTPLVDPAYWTGPVQDVAPPL